MKLSQSQREVVADMMRRDSLTPYERGQVAAWRLRAQDPDDRLLLDRLAEKEIK